MKGEELRAFTSAELRIIHDFTTGCLTSTLIESQTVILQGRNWPTGAKNACFDLTWLCKAHHLVNQT